MALGGKFLVSGWAWQATLASAEVLAAVRCLQPSLPSTRLARHGGVGRVARSEVCQPFAAHSAPQVLYKRPGQRVLVNKVRQGQRFWHACCPGVNSSNPHGPFQRVVCSSRAAAGAAGCADAPHARPMPFLPLQLGDLVVRPTFAETIIRHVPGGALPRAAHAGLGRCHASGACAQPHPHAAHAAHSHLHILISTFSSAHSHQHRSLWLLPLAGYSLSDHLMT